MPRGAAGRIGAYTRRDKSSATARRRNGPQRSARCPDDPLQRGLSRAETDIFPVTDTAGLPVIVYTCLRWGALLRPTPDDPPGFNVPRAPLWYRFALQSPSVTVALMSPETREELEEDLTVLDAAGPLSADEYALLAEHGRRVRRHGGGFA